MTLKVGLVGCGNISSIYLQNARHFADFEILACGDLNPAAAAAQATRFGIAALPVEDVLASPEIDAVLNLTVPNAHADIALAALAAGKHVYGEKPLAVTLEDARRVQGQAERNKLRVGCAPDTVLGPGIQQAMRMVAAGEIGETVTGFATVLSHGMEHWHPNPEFFYKRESGPIMDLGPYYIAALTAILGPITNVQATGRIGSQTRVISASGPNQGRSFPVEAFTSVNALLSFRCGAQIVLAASWDVWRSNYAAIELHGTAGSLRVPDPNWFAGTIEISQGGADWESRETSAGVFGAANYSVFGRNYPNYRGLGLAEMANAIRTGRPHRCSSEFALHTLEVMTAIGEAIGARREIAISPPRFGDLTLTEPAAVELLARDSELLNRDSSGNRTSSQ